MCDNLYFAQCLRVTSVQSSSKDVGPDTTAGDLASSSVGAGPHAPEPMPLLPPPPVPGAGIVAELAAHRRAAFRNPSWKVSNGFIVWDVGRESLDAHCDLLAHVNRKNPCRLNRKHRDMPGRVTAQGRPLGMELCWLEMASEYPTRELHCNAFKKTEQTPEDVERLDYPHRLDARLRHKDDPLLADLFGIERGKHLGEGEEPLEMP
jgi:hypothetical protein